MRLDKDILQTSSTYICYIAAYTYMGLYVVVTNAISMQILQGRCEAAEQGPEKGMVFGG